MPDTLRSLADRRHLLIGTAVEDAALTGEADYASKLADQFNLVVPENATKWDATEAQPGKFDFSGGDRLLAFAEQHHMQMKGGMLVWYFQNPPWVQDATFTRDQAIAVLRDHIHAVVGHFKGKVVSWDVVNEPFDDAGTKLRDNVWLRSIGSDYIAMAFRFAREADPKVKLYLNDFDVNMPGTKTDKMIQMALDLKAQGVPIDGLGSQFHVFPGVTSIDFAKVKARMKQVNDAGLDFEVSEWDMGLKLPATPADLDRQAGLAKGLMQACLAASRCPMFIVWGFTDRHNWIPSQKPGYGAATISDEQLNPKPSWNALVEALKRGM